MVSASSGWIVVLGGVGLLAFLVYMAIVVLEEKRAWRENLRLYRLGPVKIPIPSWWRRCSHRPNQLIFSSPSAGKDWHALFEYGTGVEETLGTRIAQKNILLDAPPSCQRTTELNGHIRMERVEGVGTCNQERRVYLDACLISNLKTGDSLYGECCAGVLHGPVEGPYFEECLRALLNALGGNEAANLSNQKSGDVFVRDIDIFNQLTVHKKGGDSVGHFVE